MTRAEPAVRRRAALKSAAIATAVLLLFCAVVWVVGTRTEDPPVVSSPDDGTRCAVTALDDRVGVVCLAILKAAPDAVWALIRNYDGFVDAFDARLGRIEMDDVRCETAHVSGRVAAAWGYKWPMDVTVHHEVTGEAADRRWIARWDNPSGEVEHNRGRWVLATHEAGTEVRYELDAEVAWTPKPLVNAAVKWIAPSVVDSLRNDL